MLIDEKRALAYTAVIDEIKPIEGYAKTDLSFKNVSNEYLLKHN